MHIINNNAHAVLFEKASHLQQGGHNSWRCIYINLSATRFRHNHMLLKHFIGKAIKRILAEDDGHIFMCRDGDIFILFQGMSKPILSKLGEHFDGVTLNENGQPDDHMFTLLDLSTDWNVFYHLCLAKSRQFAPMHNGAMHNYVPEEALVASEQAAT